MPTSATLATLLALSYVSVRFVSAQRRCFWPSGTPSSDYPCKPAASASACCALGWDCLSNGLCRQQGSGPYRGSCTDQTWSTNECPLYCAFNNTGPAFLIRCNAGSTVGDGGAELSSYCCDNDSYCNCTTGDNVILLNPNPATVTVLDYPSMSTESSTSTASSTTSIPSISTLTPSVSTSNLVATTPLSSATAEASSHQTVAIGVGLGVLSGLTILGVVPFLLLRIRDLRRTTTQPNLDIRTEQPFISHMRQPSIAEIQQPSIAEMPQPSIAEM